MEEKPSYTGHRARIKQKFNLVGLKPFLDHEILELLLTYSIPRKDTKQIAWRLIKKYHSLVGVLDAPKEDLLAIEGIGPQSATLIKLVREIITRYRYERVQTRIDIRNRQEVYNYCRAHLQGKKNEFFEVLFLDIKSRLITSEIICEGTIDRAEFSPRKFLELVLKYGAKSVICIHNHPSGDPTPSSEDEYITDCLKRMLMPLSVDMLDHLIVGANRIYSLEYHQYIERSKII